MQKEKIYGQKLEVDVIHWTDDRKKVADAVVVFKNDGTLSFTLLQDMVLPAGQTYEFLLKPGSEYTLYRPKNP